MIMAFIRRLWNNELAEEIITDKDILYIMHSSDEEFADDWACHKAEMWFDANDDIDILCENNKNKLLFKFKLLIIGNMHPQYIEYLMFRDKVPRKYASCEVIAENYDYILVKNLEVNLAELYEFIAWAPTYGYGILPKSVVQQIYDIDFESNADLLRQITAIPSDVIRKWEGSETLLLACSYALLNCLELSNRVDALREIFEPGTVH